MKELPTYEDTLLTKEKILFIHYPKCTTCQKIQKDLENRGFTLELRNIKENPPSKQELKSWWKKSQRPLKAFFNTSGLVYKNLHLKEKLPTLKEEEQLDLLASNGMLVKRPLLVQEDRVFLASTYIKE